MHIRIIFFILFLQIQAYSQDINLENINKTSYFIIDSISLKGNSLTKDYIIYREITLNVGDTIEKLHLQNSLTESKNNIQNTSLFNFVNVDIDTIAYNKIRLEFKLTERWYVWPFPIFELSERNFNTWWETKDLNKTNYGFFITHDNFRGRKESISVLVSMGYNQQYSFFYKIPYLNKNQTIGTSIGFSYKQTHNVNYNSENNKSLNLKHPEQIMQHEWVGFIQFSYRPKIKRYHAVQFSYHNFNFADTIFKLNSEYNLKSANNTELLKFNYYFKLDFRDNVAYPLKGFYNLNEISYISEASLKSNRLQFTNAKFKISQYFEFNKYMHAAISGVAKISSNNEQPYFLQRGLGYGNDFVRGYEYYIFDGNNYIFAKSNFKFTLLNNKIFKIKFIKTEKFNTIPISIYLNTHADYGKIIDDKYNHNNSMNNKNLFGYGTGIDFVTYYDKVLRIEYSWNHLKEKNIYIHFIAPI